MTCSHSKRRRCHGGQCDLQSRSATDHWRSCPVCPPVSAPVNCPALHPVCARCSMLRFARSAHKLTSQAIVVASSDFKSIWKLCNKILSGTLAATSPPRFVVTTAATQLSAITLQPNKATWAPLCLSQTKKLAPLLSR